MELTYEISLTWKKLWSKHNLADFHHSLKSRLSGDQGEFQCRGQIRKAEWASPLECLPLCIPPLEAHLGKESSRRRYWWLLFACISLWCNQATKGKIRYKGKPMKTITVTRPKLFFKKFFLNWRTWGSLGELEEFIKF